MNNAQALHLELTKMVEEGLLRHLGAAFSHFIGTLHGDASSAPLLLAVAILSEMDGQGHSCLDLNDLVPEPCMLTGWPAERWSILREAGGTLPGSAEEWREALLRCPQVRCTETADSYQPLVLDQHRLYLRRHWDDESLVAAAVSRRASRSRMVDVEKIRYWLDRLFDAMPEQNGPDWQKIACAVAIRSNLSIITGGPGTGKTYTVARLLALLFAVTDNPAGLRIALAAPTGKAATRLKQSIDSALADLSHKVGTDLPLGELTARIGGASTLHSLLGARPHTRRLRHHASNPLDVDVLIVDEASMVHLEMMASVLYAVPDDTMLILLGDKDQLASVEAGAVLGDLCYRSEAGGYSHETASYVEAACGQTIPQRMLGGSGPLAQQTVMLRHSRRFDGPIGALAKSVNDGMPAEAAAILRLAEKQRVSWIDAGRQDDVLELAVQGRDGAGTGYREYLAKLSLQPQSQDVAAHHVWVRSLLQAFDAFRILCAVRQGEWGVAGINAALEHALDASGALRCRGEWYCGRPVMVTRNDRSLGVFNGDVGIALPDPVRRETLRVYFLQGESIRSVLATRLPYVETAYAMTVHKAQGSEFLHAVMVLPAKGTMAATRELVYTGITRAKDHFTLVSPDATILEKAIQKRTRRTSGLQSQIAEKMVTVRY